MPNCELCGSDGPKEHGTIEEINNEIWSRPGLGRSPDVTFCNICLTRYGEEGARIRILERKVEWLLTVVGSLCSGPGYRPPRQVVEIPLGDLTAKEAEEMIRLAGKEKG